MGNGTVTLLETFEEKEKGLQRIMEHMAPGAKIEFRPEMLTRTAVWQINVYEFTGKERKAKYVERSKVRTGTKRNRSISMSKGGALI